MCHWLDARMNPHHFDPDPVGSALVIVYDACEGRLRADGTPAVMHPLAVMRLVHQADSRDPVTLADAGEESGTLPAQPIPEDHVQALSLIHI